MAGIHNRMPSHPGRKRLVKMAWRRTGHRTGIAGAAAAVPDEWLKIWPEDNKVGNVRNTGRELMLPLGEPLL
jgi:hypothetical protein